MVGITSIAAGASVWAMIYLVDHFLKTQHWSSRMYLAFVNRTGLSMTFGHIRIFLTSFNRIFLRMGSWKPRLMEIWFMCGVCFGLFAMIISLFILVIIIWNTLNQQPMEQQVLTPVMPGINLPMSQIGYYLTTLLFCGIFHEIGHAVAAAREQVRVNGFGIFIFIVYPGAFVDLYSEHLQVISPLRQLRIYCAGVWHNCVLVILAILILITLPWTLTPIYSIGNGVCITSVSENSAISGPRGIYVGDEITKISDCRITSASDWNTCIQVAMSEKRSGFCISVDLLKQQDISTKVDTTSSGYVECCSNTSNTHLCFAYNMKGTFSQSYSCLPARTTTEKLPCKLHSDCKLLKKKSVCVVPSLENSTKLLKIHRTGKPPILFLGHPLDLHFSVLMSDFVPKSNISPMYLPSVIETFSKYVISLSGALAILNVVPCYALDGQWILLAFIELALNSAIPNRATRNVISSCILLFGTSLLTINIIIAMWVLIR